MEYFKKYKYIYRHPYKDRTFSQIMRHLLSFFISKILNITHIHTNYFTPELDNMFETIFRKEYLIDKTSNEFNINELIRKKEIFSKPDEDLSKPFDINDIFSNEYIDTIKQSYKLNKHSDNFNTNDLNIAVHIRRGDIDGKPYVGRYTSIEFYMDVVNKLKLLLPNSKVHVYSDSSIDLKIPNIFYHINEDLLVSIHDIINSDIFIMSIGSNLSHFACLLSDGLVFLDKSKLKYCFNNKNNIYWSKYRNIIIEEEQFMDKIKTKWSV